MEFQIQMILYHLTTQRINLNEKKVNKLEKRCGEKGSLHIIPQCKFGAAIMKSSIMESSKNLNMEILGNQLSHIWIFTLKVQNH